MAVTGKKRKCIDDLFELPENKKSCTIQSTVSRKVKTGVHVVTKEVKVYVDKLIKIEFYDLNLLRNISPMDHWKHSDLKLKYYYNSEVEKIEEDLTDNIYDIVKSVMETEGSQKIFFERNKIKNDFMDEDAFEYSLHNSKYDIELYNLCTTIEQELIGNNVKSISETPTTLEINCVQRFVERPNYTEVNPGEDALLKCRVSDKKGVCSWQKDNKPVGLHRGKYEWANEDSPVGGDCSLWIRAATLQLDDGQWQCQVTASNYDVQDALSSPPAALAVRVPPQSPRILFNGSHAAPGSAITVTAGARATVVCEARYGNPPAYIEWFLEQERLTAWSQTNASEVERPRVWAARSVLELGATRAAHGRQLSCRAHHPSYPAPRYRDAYTMLDVTFTPVVSISGADASTLASLEEGSSALSLECKAEGNPAPYVWWTKDGQVVATTGPKLILAPVSRNHSGVYSCQARNSLGTSDTAKIEIDVKYPPRVTWVGPDSVVEASLFSRMVLDCKAEGNPLPTYQWLHSPNPGGRDANVGGGYPVGTSAQLVLYNVSYAQHGRYVCLATNQIGLEERSQQSEPITLNVLGPPVGAGGAAGSARAWSGGEARVSATVCAEPPPRRAAWLWGSLRLHVPSSVGRYRALEPTGAGGAPGCYRYTLVVSDASVADARVYVLHVENERGSSAHAVTLTIHETAHVAPLIAAGLVIAALLVIVICLVIKCRRRRRESVQYKTEDLDNEKTVLPADAVYSQREARTATLDRGREEPRYSPGALQVRRAALVLQPPTTV